jgi:hypothetical protein
MALPTTSVWEIRNTGHFSNGAGFNPSRAGGIDRSQQDEPHVVIDGATITATIHTAPAQLNLTGYTVILGDVGNFVQILTGASTNGFFEITAVDIPNNRWVLDRTVGTAGATITGRMGGAANGPQRIFLSAGAGHRYWWKSGTYQQNNGNSGAEFGATLGTFATSAEPIFVRGYKTTRGDDAERPLVLISGAGYATAYSVRVGQGWQVRGIEIDANALSGIIAFSASGVRSTAIDCIARGCDGANGKGFETINTECCAAYDCSTGGQGGTHERLFVHNNVGGSILGTGLASPVGVDRCIFVNIINPITGAPARVTNCVAYKTTNGFTAGSSYTHFDNCISHTSTRGFYVASNTGHARFTNCFAYACTTAFSNLNGTAPGGTADSFESSCATLTADPFENVAISDFRLNNTAGGGATCKNQSHPVPIIHNNGAPTLLASSFDAGALQSAAVGGGGGTTNPLPGIGSAIIQGGLF